MGPDMETYEYCKNSTDAKNEAEEDWIIHMTVLKGLLIGGYAITFILGTIGNGLVIWVAGFKLKKTVYTIWFLNLGVADFASCTVMPFISIRFILQEYWSFSRFLCKTLPVLIFFMYFSLSVSTALITIISVDRCVSILCPVWCKIHRTPSRAVIVSVVAWLWSLIMSIQNVTFYYVYSSNNSSDCFQYASEQYFHQHKFMIYARFIYMFLIPFLIIFICHVLIVFQLRKRQNFSKNKQPFKVIAAVVLCFFFCWFPFHIKVFINPCNLGEKIFTLFWFTASFLGNFNSCLNPIIYVFTFYDFQSALSKSISLSLQKALKDDISEHASK